MKNSELLAWFLIYIVASIVCGLFILLYKAIDGKYSGTEKSFLKAWLECIPLGFLFLGVIITTAVCLTHLSQYLNTLPQLIK